MAQSQSTTSGGLIPSGVDTASMVITGSPLRARSSVSSVALTCRSNCWSTRYFSSARLRWDRSGDSSCSSWVDPPRGTQLVAFVGFHAFDSHNGKLLKLLTSNSVDSTGRLFMEYLFLGFDDGYFFIVGQIVFKVAVIVHHSCNISSTWRNLSVQPSRL